ncbi:hypothetical protein fHeYen901_94 [Yersinia phage fHe-Yen9-01]|uniref:Uncharacterized protein n=1 Tax=Yersinia phage fHe-Yen9-01 TaxID=1965363 RepID=A0A1V0DXJ0_9CAUD|nr:hypothetical protein KNT60_gp093 [Yersinia phage fHe-Yen9-01]ARB05867.1 hypothetical protein fHeYen901_94 [Yersinia phage fHe-Yen9-01]
MSLFTELKDLITTEIDDKYSDRTVFSNSSVRIDDSFLENLYDKVSELSGFHPICDAPGWDPRNVNTRDETLESSKFMSPNSLFTEFVKLFKRKNVFSKYSAEQKLSKLGVYRNTGRFVVNGDNAFTTDNSALWLVSYLNMESNRLIAQGARLCSGNDRVVVKVRTKHFIASISKTCKDSITIDLAKPYHFARNKLHVLKMLNAMSIVDKVHDNGTTLCVQLNSLYFKTESNSSDYFIAEPVKESIPSAIIECTAKLQESLNEVLAEKNKLLAQVIVLDKTAAKLQESLRTLK